MSGGPMLIRNRPSSIKEKLLGKRTNRSSVKQSGEKPRLNSSKSTPSLFVRSSNQYNVILDDVVMLHCLEELTNANIFVRFLQYTRALKTWETHHIHLGPDSITSETPTGIFSLPLDYSSIHQTIPIDLKRDPINYCVKLCTASNSILLHVKNSHDRDRWLHSLQWKINVCNARVKLFSALKPEELLQELQNLVHLTINCPLYVDGTHQVILDLVSTLLVQKSETINTMCHEDIIKTLAPLVEKNQPSFEICAFFTKHCRQSPRSLVVVEMFTPIVQRILKHTVDFGKMSWLRTLVVEYVQALNSQNNGKEAVKKFVQAMHGPLRNCPHTRILNNLVAVCLSAIYQCFSSDKSKKKPTKGKWTKEHYLNSNHVSPNQESLLNNYMSCVKSNLKNQELMSTKCYNNVEDDKPLNTDVTRTGDLNLKENYSRMEKRLSIVSVDPSQQLLISDDQLATVTLFVDVLYQISEIEDWRPGLASFLQPLPFPEGAMSNIKFMRLMYPVIERFAEDERESVVKCLLYSRDDKEGWLHVYSPGGFACEDKGKLFIKMMEALLQPGMQCGKMKKFMTTLARTHLEVIIMLALRENQTMINVLRDMLQMGCLLDEQEQLQVISSLRCTATGREVYDLLKQELSSLNQKSGPKSFTLAPNSTDTDLITLLSSGSWGNLECLNLSFTNVTSHGVDVITRLPNLKHLNLWSTSFDDDGLKKLCDYLDLEWLNLCETRVTNKGIECLEAMTNLEYLNLNSTRLDLTTFLNLKKKLPNLLHFDINYTAAMFEL